MIERSVKDPTQLVRDVVCTACGCLCDDIDVTVDRGRVVEAQRACALGQEWLLRERRRDLPAATIAGQPADFDVAIQEAAQILAAAHYPLVYGLSHTTCEAQRRAVAIGDWIGACVDTVTSRRHGVTGTSFAGVGEVTCTLGEVRHRGDLVIFWGTDPAQSHPRHAERYSLVPQGMFVPRGRADRTCVVVDVRRTESADLADQFLQIKPGRDFEALWVLRALAQGMPIDAAQVEEDTGVPLAEWQGLMQRMKQARFGAICYGAGLATTRGRQINVDAVMALVRDMNMFNRFVALPMRGQGNVGGADEVLLWNTGYAHGVNLSRGFPRFGPGEFTVAEVLQRGEADAALVIGSELLADLPQAAREHLAKIPCVCIDSEAGSGWPAARVQVRTAAPGVAAAGTMYRMDDVPLPVREVVASPYPSDADVLARLESSIKQLRGYGPAPLLKERSRLV